MDDRLYLGIDGGGTASRARLLAASGRVLGEGFAGSSNLTLGIDVATEAIRAATDAAFDAAGLPRARQSAVRAGLGLAGANVPGLAAAMQAAPLPFHSVAVVSDAVTACLGAHGGADGAILILGTGSQGLAFVGGETRTVGGWGFAISDDGSGAILGRAAVRRAILTCDGLAPDTALTAAIMAHFSGDPANAVAWARTAAPRDYGAFAPFVVDFHAAGDPAALALVAESLDAVIHLIDRLIAYGAARVTLMGGLADFYRSLLPARFDAMLVEAEGDAMDGALILARREAAA